FRNCRRRSRSRRGSRLRGRRLVRHGLCARIGCVRVNDHGSDLLGLGRCARTLPRRRRHDPRSGLASRLLERDRLFLLRHDPFPVGVRRAILRRVARLRIAGARRHDLRRRGIVGPDHRRPLRRTGIAVIAPVGIGAGGAEHGATDEGERGGEAATPRARRVVIHLMFVRLERDVVLVGVLGLLSLVLAAIRVVVVVVLALLVRSVLGLVVVLALLVRAVLGLVVVLALLVRCGGGLVVVLALLVGFVLVLVVVLALLVRSVLGLVVVLALLVRSVLGLVVVLALLVRSVLGLVVE